jgi:aspartate aminotransferase-like enzyme
MPNIVPRWYPPERVLMGPGPSEVPARVREALAAPTLGHLDPEYLRIMDETRGLLQQVFRTTNPLTLAVPGSGTGKAWRIGLMGASSSPRHVTLLLAALEQLLRP